MNDLRQGRMRSERPVYHLYIYIYNIFFSFGNFGCIHVCVPGDLARTVQTAGDVYDDFVVAKNNKLKHDKGKDNSDVLGCAKVFF